MKKTVDIHLRMGYNACIGNEENKNYERRAKMKNIEIVEWFVDEFNDDEDLAGHFGVFNQNGFCKAYFGSWDKAEKYANELNEKSEV